MSYRSSSSDSDVDIDDFKDDDEMITTTNATGVSAQGHPPVQPITSILNQKFNPPTTSSSEAVLDLAAVSSYGGKESPRSSSSQHVATISAERKPNSYRMTRICIVNLLKLEVLPLPSNILYPGGLVRIAVYFQESKKRNLQTIPQVVPEHGLLDVINLNILFSLTYMHHFKRKMDMLYIEVQHKHTKQSRKVRSLGRVAISLAHVLQCPFDDVLTIRSLPPKSDHKQSAGAAPVSSQQEPIARLHVKIKTIPVDGDAWEKATDKRSPARSQHFGAGSPSGSDTESEDSVPSDDDVEIHGVNNEELSSVATSESKKPMSKLSDYLAKKKQSMKLLNKKQANNNNNNKKHPSSKHSKKKGSDSDTSVESDNEPAPSEVGSQHYLTNMSATGHEQPWGEDDEGERSPTNEGYSSPPAPPPPPIPENYQPSDVSSVATPSGDFAEQLERVLAEVPGHPQKEIVFVNTLTRRGKKVGEWLQRKGGPFKHKTLCTKGSEDVVTAMSKIISSYQRSFDDAGEEFEGVYKVAIVGTDCYINDVLRAYVQTMTAEKQNTSVAEPLLFYYIPIGKSNKNDIARYIGSLDPKYATSFANDEWSQLFAKKEQLTKEEGTRVENEIAKYLKEASKPLKLSIAEAFLTYVSNVNQTSVPFIKSVQVGSVSGDDADSPPTEPVELKLDFWEVKNNNSKDIHKSSLKASFQCISAMRIPLREVPYVFPSSLAMLGSSFVLWTAKEEKKLIGLKKFPICDKAQKMICSSKESKKGFSVMIDGVAWAGVKFVSVSPKWITPLHFPVAQF
eukprot:GEZU01019799.1.p1 GENE.GEZU01019799.1~~GEZU01019799.1.p1  ORF type:complete len:792 (-),score=134.29 GEZU01019799.1:183-2558(-)